MNWAASLAKWRADRDIQAQPESVFVSMIEEEREEYRDAVKANDWEEQVDAVCDQIVLTSNHLHFHPDRLDLIEALDNLLTIDLPALGVVPDLAMKQTLKEISSRVQDPSQKQKWSEQGGNVLGEKWQKDKNQASSTLYKANYNVCKLHKA